MKVIIIGAGKVGFVAAETICNTHDVTVVESDSSTAESVKNRLNVSVLNDDGTNPLIIKKTIEHIGADMIISTLNRDDSNLFVCMMAKRIKQDIVTVASITNPDFIISTSNDGVEGVDVIISPELITAQKMHMLCILENAIDFETMPLFDCYISTFLVSPDSPLIGSAVLNTYQFTDSSIFTIYRNGSLYFQVDTMEIHAGDMLGIIGSREAIFKYNEKLGMKHRSRDIIILGGTIVGEHLADLLSQDKKNRYIRIIEKNQERCRDLSKSLNGVVVINGDFTEPDMQNNENIFKCDCLVASSNQDDTNLLMCMSAQNHNTSKIISRYLKKEYRDIFTFTGLDTIVGFDNIVANEISKCIVSLDRRLMNRNRDETFFVHDVDSESKIVDRYYGDLALPNGIRILAIRRGNRTLYPRMDLKFTVSDQVLIYTNLTNNKEIANIFGRNAVSEN